MASVADDSAGVARGLELVVGGDVGGDYARIAVAVRALVLSPDTAQSVSSGPVVS